MPQGRWENRRNDDRIAEDADQTEVMAIRYGSCNLEAGTFDDRIAGALDDFEVTDPLDVPSWAADDIKVDNAASEVALELNRRAAILGDAYPFTFDRNRILYRQSQTLVYEFCLAVSEAPSLTKGKFQKLPIAFERLVRDTLICFLGPGANGMRTGWPGDEHEPRPTRFKQVVEKLRGRAGEWVWSPDPGLPDDPGDDKDVGLDVVVWKGVSDQRAGKLFLLAQCACGNGFKTKFHDIDGGFVRLGKWIKPISYVMPIRVFCTPRHIPNDLDFSQTHKEAGFTFDRARLTLLAEQVSHREFITAEAKESYSSLMELVIAPPAD